MHIHPNTTLEKDPISGGPNPWKDVRVRKAANMAVDLDTIIKTILTGAEKRSFGSAQRSVGFPKDLEAKVKALNAYRSQLVDNQHPGKPSVISSVCDRTRYWGHLAGVLHAEPFTSREPVGLRGLRDLLL